MDKTIIFAHRGLWGRHPENSIGAIKAAIQQGFGVEIDLRVTKNKVLVVHHDSNLERMTGVKREISESTFEQIQECSLLDSNEGIPKLVDVLQLSELLGSQMALQVKDFFRDDIASLLLEAIPDGVLNSIFLFDIPLELCVRLKKASPNLRVGVSVGDRKYHPYYYDLDDLEGTPVDVVWADEYRKLYSARFISKVHSMGMLVCAVSPDIASAVGHPRAYEGYRQTWEDLLSWGVDGICTDRPQELRKLILENS